MAEVIPVTISHRFKASEIETEGGVGENLHYEKIDVVHKGVKLVLGLALSVRCSWIVVWATYIDGPNDLIKLEYNFSASDGCKPFPITDGSSAIEIGKGKRWNPGKKEPALAKALKENGYLDVRAELSIKADAFIAPLQVFASLSHNFSIRQLLNYDYRREAVDDGCVVSVAHNNAKLSFKLVADKNDRGEGIGVEGGGGGGGGGGFGGGYGGGFGGGGGGRIGLYVQCVGAEPHIGEFALDLELIAIKYRKREILMKKRRFRVSPAVRLRCASLPRTFNELSDGGYLSLDREYIHIIAELSIPESAFQTSIRGPLPHVQLDALGLYFFQEISTATATDSPTSDRVELISSDDTHLWAHKAVLSFASDVFKDLFDPNKPEETKMESLKKGFMEIDLSGDALKQMMHFIYLRQADKDFGSFAWEILPVADRFLIKGLKEECERSLIDQLDTLEVEDLSLCAEHSHTFSLNTLAAACVKMLTKQKHNVEQSLVVTLIELAKQHSHGELKSACEDNLLRKLETANDRDSFVALVSIARQHDLGVLTNHCVQWFKNNFTQLKALGFVDGLEADNSDHGRNLIHFLLESMAVLPVVLPPPVREDYVLDVMDDYGNDEDWM